MRDGSWGYPARRPALAALRILFFFDSPLALSGRVPGETGDLGTW
jgi:hypothetical protein